MSKSLETLEVLVKHIEVEATVEDLEQVKNAHKQLQQDLEVLQILKTKQVDINFFKTLIPHNKTIKQLQSAYNMCFVQWARLTLDEIRKLKRWIENES